MNYVSIQKLVEHGHVAIKTGPFGTQLKASEYVSHGTPVLNVRNLGFATVNTEKLEMIGAETLERLSAHKLMTGDIVFGRKGAVERHGFISTDENGWMQGSDCIRLRVLTDAVNPRFLSYYFLTRRHKAFMINMCSHGTTMASLNQKIIEKIEVPLPARPIQDKIVGLLSRFDKRIATNQKINKNLEQQAQAYFDELFVVNTDPNWPECTLSDIGTIVAGGTPSKSKVEYYADRGIAWITPKDLSVDKSKFISRGENDISELGFSKSSAAKMPAGTVLFSSRAPIGYIAIAQNEVTTNQGFKSIIPKKNIGTPYVYFLLKKLLPTIEGMASGSTFKEISGTGMKSVPTVMPDVSTIQLFNAFCEPVFKEQEVLEAENKHLSALRDSLLPKLMSGAIDVSELDL